MTNGYTGDLVCKDCGKLVEVGHEIAAKGVHSGKLELIPGTAKEGSCTERSYEGDYRCSDCGGKVKGKNGSYVHETKIVGKIDATFKSEGYTGDKYCIKCGEMLREGEVIPRLNVNDYVFITNQIPYSLTPYECEVGDVIHTSFDGVLDKKLEKEGYHITVSSGYIIGKQLTLGEAGESNHSKVDVDLTKAGDYQLIRVVNLFDSTDNLVGTVSTTTILHCTEAACAHNFTLIQDTSTCNKAGTKFYKCSKCGKSKSVASAASGKHVYSEKCSYNDSQCYYKCIYCGAKKDCQDHKFVETGRKSINCTSADITYKCSRCGFTKTSRVNGINNHEYNANMGVFRNETEHWMYCIKCGNKRTEKHTFDGDQCTFCMYIKNHPINYNTYNGNYIEIPSLICVHQSISVDMSHVSKALQNKLVGSYLVWTAYLPSGSVQLGKGGTLNLNSLSADLKKQLQGNTVTVALMVENSTILYCDATVYFDISVGAVQADCAHDGSKAHNHCPICGKDTDGNFNEINTTVPATGKHVYDNNCDAYCNICGYKREIKHSYGKTIFSDGNGHWQKCSICGALSNVHAHTPGEWITDKAATCTEKGERHISCEECGYIIITESTAVTHSYVGSETKQGCETDGCRTWTCESCGETITSVLLATGHSISHYPEKAATCSSNGCKEHYGCILCGKTFADSEGEKAVDAESLIIPKNPNNHVGILYYGYNNNGHWGICHCGKTITKEETHKFENGKCTVCAVTPTEAEKKKAVVPEEVPEEVPDEPTDIKPGSGNKILKIVLLILIPILVIIAALVVFLVFWKKKQKKISENNQN